MQRLISYSSASFRYVRRFKFGVRRFVHCREMSIRDFLRFCIRIPDADIRLIAQKDLNLLDANLPSAPYRTHSDDFADHEAGSVSMAIAWLYGHPVGQGIIRWLGPQKAAVSDKLGPIPEIFRLYVTRELRSLGIGARLVQFLEQLAKNRGYTSIGLGVSINSPRARNFYEQIGYAGSGIIYTEEWTYPQDDKTAMHVRDENEFLIKNLT